MKPQKSFTETINEASDQLELPSRTKAAAHHFWLQFTEFIQEKKSVGDAGDGEKIPTLLDQQVTMARQLDPWLVLISCLHLACKSTECHRKLRDLVNVVYTCLSPSHDFYRITDEYWKLRESVGVTEFFLLRIINFHVFVDSPYGWAMHICRMLFEGDHANQMKDWHTVGKAVFQVVDILLNDLVVSSVFHAHAPRALGCAVVTLAMVSLTIPLPLPKEEWCRTWGDMSANRCDRILKEVVSAVQKQCRKEVDRLEKQEKTQ